MFYTGDQPPRLKEGDVFDEIATKIAGATLQQNQRIPTDLLRAIGEAVYELFRNTEEHGKSDQFGDTVRRSIRGVHARRHELVREDLARMVEEMPPLAEYCAGLPTARRDAAHVQLLEVSVFDSGAGFASRMSGTPLRDLDPDKELDEIRNCFLKHATVKTDDGAGLGLCNIVDILRARQGFLRLRTGRHSLYADLSREGGRPYGTLPDLRHWGKRQRRLAPVAGSLISFFIPIVRG